LSLLFIKYGIKPISNYLPFLDLREGMHLNYIQSYFGNTVCANEQYLVSQYYDTLLTNGSCCPFNVYLPEKFNT
jgi:hypothetical protein